MTSASSLINQLLTWLTVSMSDDLMECMCALQNGSKEEPQSILIGRTLEEFEESTQRQTRPGVVPWSPPQQNWNPWIAANIDEGPLASVSAHTV